MKSETTETVRPACFDLIEKVFRLAQEDQRNGVKRKPQHWLDKEHKLMDALGEQPERGSDQWKDVWALYRALLPYSKPWMTAEAKSLQQVMEENPLLHIGGYGYSRCGTCGTMENLSEHREILAKEEPAFQKTIAWLRRNGVRTHSNTYGEKHVMERHIRLYVTNGVFAAAMLALGFQFKKMDRWTLNPSW